MPKRPESRVGEIHDYFRSLLTVYPDDFPSERFEALSPGVHDGMRQLWNYIHMRRYIATEFPIIEDRRQLEQGIRNRMAELRANDTTETSERRVVLEYIGRLSAVHQLSVTADQAELSAASFVQ